MQLTENPLHPFQMLRSMFQPGEKYLASLTSMIGNVRIMDANGYEYRTNMQGVGIDQEDPATPFQIYTFNFNTKSGVTLSDVVGIALNGLGNEEVSASADIYSAFDVDIFPML